MLNKIKSYITYILHKSLNILLLIELLEDLKIKNTVGIELAHLSGIQKIKVACQCNSPQI